MRKETMWLLRSVVGCCVVVMAGCVGPLKYYIAPISDADVLPNGTVGEIKNNPKRNAASDEVQAIQRAMRTNPLLEASPQAVSGVRVEDVNKPVLGFCGRLAESAQAENKDNAEPAPVMTGVLKTVEGKLYAYDMRYGEQAQLRCNYMKFWNDSE